MDSVYADGLQADFDYCIPRIAALGALLDGDLERAVCCVLQDRGLFAANKESLLAWLRALASDGEIRP